MVLSSGNKFKYFKIISFCGYEIYNYFGRNLLGRIKINSYESLQHSYSQLYQSNPIHYKKGKRVFNNCLNC